LHCTPRQKHLVSRFYCLHQQDKPDETDPWPERDVGSGCRAVLERQSLGKTQGSLANIFMAAIIINTLALASICLHRIAGLFSAAGESVRHKNVNQPMFRSFFDE